MRKILCVLVAIALSLGACTTGYAVAEDQPVVGAVLPLSGEFAFFGEHMLQGMKIAQEEINANGGINGVPLEIVVEDNGKVDAKKSIAAVNKLVSVDNADIIIASTAIDAMPIVPVVEGTSVPVISVWDATYDLAQFDNAFSVGYGTERTGEKMAAYALENYAIEKVAVIYHKDYWSSTIAKAFHEHMEDAGVNVVVVEETSVDELNYRNALVKAKSEGADIIYAPLYPTPLLSLMKQREELSVDSTLFSGDGVFAEVWPQPEAEGTIFTSMLKTGEGTDLYAAYVQKYNSEPELYAGVVLGYDAVMVGAQALRTHPKNAKQGLKAIDSLPASQGTITFDDGGLAARSQFIYEVVDNEPVLLQE